MTRLRGLDRLGQRHRLLVLGLGPLLLALPILALIQVLWGGPALDAISTTRVRSDLAAARGYFERVQAEAGAGTLAVAQSLALHDAIGRNDTAALQLLLSRARQQHALEFLNLWPGPPPAASERQAADGSEGLAQLALLDAREFDAIAPELRSRVGVPLAPARDAEPGQRQREERALVMLAHAPVRALNGRLLGHLQGGVLLNRNLAFVDHIERMVYPPDALRAGSPGKATLFIDDLRIATTPRPSGAQGQDRAIGTRAAQPVSEAVLGRGETWVGRSEVAGQTYLAAYLPLGDAAGRRVGMLAVGVVDAPFQQARRIVLLGIGGVLLALMAAAAWLALRWSRERDDDDDDDDELLTVVLPPEPEPEPEPEPMVGPIAADPEPPPAAGPVRPATDA
jgi:two-component system, NtrC family, sensor kinase